MIIKTNKYRNQRVELDGYTFASKAEAKRYGELKLLDLAGKISGLEVHPSYTLRINNQKICTYNADFCYWEDGKQIVEDVKGFRTQVYGLKKKLMKALLGIEIVEIGRKPRKRRKKTNETGGGA